MQKIREEKQEHKIFKQDFKKKGEQRCYFQSLVL